MKLHQIGLLGLAALGLGGCGLIDKPTPPPHAGPYPFHAKSEQPPALRRVVLLPLASETCDAQQKIQLERSLSLALGARNLFELIPVGDRDVADTKIVSTRNTGTYLTEDLILLSRRFGAEGVLHGVVTHFQSYPQVLIGLRLTLLDCRSGQVPWATDVVLDASSRIIEQDVHNYYDTVLRDQGSLLDYEQVLISPRLFGEYAAYRISNTLAVALGPRPEAEGDSARP